MLIDPGTLRTDHSRLEEIEKASLRLVAQAMFNFRKEAEDVFHKESDKPQDICEDLTREALDRISVSRVEKRLFGKIDYKRARYIFHPDYAVKQALFIDSKAEKDSQASARIQTAQLSMIVKQVINGRPIEVQGGVPHILEVDSQSFITTTLFVKYHYKESGKKKFLKGMTLAAVPNGILQEVYNPTPQETIFIKGPDAHNNAEKFRTRLSFARLAAKAKWRIQKIAVSDEELSWEE